MHRSLVRAYAHQPFLLDKLEVLETELQDINQDEEALLFHNAKKCILHRFSHDWEMEYVVLQHWSDHVGASFSLSDEPDKEGFFKAYINI